MSAVRHLINLVSSIPLEPARPSSGTRRRTTCRTPTPRRAPRATTTTAIVTCSSVAARWIRRDRSPPCDVSSSPTRASPPSRDGSRTTGTAFRNVSVFHSNVTLVFLLHRRYGVLFIAAGFITVIVSDGPGYLSNHWPRFTIAAGHLARVVRHGAMAPGSIPIVLSISPRVRFIIRGHGLSLLWRYHSYRWGSFFFFSLFHSQCIVGARHP